MTFIPGLRKSPTKPKHLIEGVSFEFGWVECQCGEIIRTAPRPETFHTDPFDEALADAFARHCGRRAGVKG